MLQWTYGFWKNQFHIDPTTLGERRLRRRLRSDHCFSPHLQFQLIPRTGYFGLLFWGVRQLYGFFKMDIMLIEPAMSQVCGMSHQETLPWDESMKEQVVEDIPIPCLTSPLCPKRLCVRTLQSLQWRLSHCHENCNRSSRLEIWFSVMCMVWHTHLM